MLDRWLSLDLLCRYIAHGRGTLREDRCREHGDSDERGCDFRKHDNLLKSASALLPGTVILTGLFADQRDTALLRLNTV
jgi:hypothetical protein